MEQPQEPLKVKIDLFKARHHQKAPIEAIEKDGFKRMVLVWSRRGGKDILCWNIMIRQALMRLGNYFYVFPNKEQARNAIWTSITNDGRKFIDFIPPQIIQRIDNVRMSITLVNGSSIQLMGAKTYNSMTGTNPKGIVFSEFAQSEPLALQYVLPILKYNGGWLILQSTPRSKNDFYKYYCIAKDNPQSWYLDIKTVDDIKHITKKSIQDDIDKGVISPDMVQQEYYCSFSLGAAGAYYAHYLDRMEIEERVTDVPWDPSYPVSTAWDLGVDDYTAIIWYQVIGQKICIIESFQDKDQGLEYYARIVKDRPYQYSKHFMPHDVKGRDRGTGITRYSKLKQLGVTPYVVELSHIMDGIEAVRTMLPRTWINRKTNPDLLKALEHYRKEWSEHRQMYLEKPRHDRYSDMADALRYLAQSYKLNQETMTKEDTQKIKNRAYGRTRQSHIFGRW